MYRALVAVSIGLMVGLMTFATVGHAAIKNSNSCSQNDVQNAIDSAGNGDTVVVPGGHCTWSSGVSVPDSKKIVIQGAGKTATIITMSGSAAAINLNRSGSRLTQFKFILPSGSSGYAVHVYGHGWRIDHNEFDNRTSSNKMGVYVRGTSAYPEPTGLIDNCTFLNARVNIHGDASLTAHKTWYTDYKLGTQNFIFIEDNDFNRTMFGNSVDSQYGGNYVFRYNNVLNSNTEAHSATQGDGSHRASRLWEIYGNTFRSTNNTYAPFRQRGGTGVIFNNTVSGNYDDPYILLDNVRTYQGQCSSYPCRDQVGRGRDAWLWTSGNPSPPQTLTPAYAWDNLNTDNGSSVIFKVVNNSEGVLALNRDFYNSKKNGYVPYTYPHPFQGAVGSGNILIPPQNLRISTNAN